MKTILALFFAPLGIWMLISLGPPFGFWRILAIIALAGWFVLEILRWIASFKAYHSRNKSTQPPWMDEDDD